MDKPNLSPIKGHSPDFIPESNIIYKAFYIKLRFIENLNLNIYISFIQYLDEKLFLDGNFLCHNMLSIGRVKAKYPVSDGVFSAMPCQVFACIYSNNRGETLPLVNLFNKSELLFINSKEYLAFSLTYYLLLSTYKKLF